MAASGGVHAGAGGTGGGGSVGNNGSPNTGAEAAVIPEHLEMAVPAVRVLL